MKKALCLTIVCLLMHAIIYAQTDWHITGNAGTNATTNFIGTTDNLPLIFRTNNAERMRILTTGELGIGVTAPLQKLDVNGNINLRNGFALFMGNHRALKIDSANKNTYLGIGVAANSTGFNNTGTGYNALFTNTIGINNTANGLNTLFSNTSGSLNTAVGNNSLFSNSTGNENTASGANALYANTTGTDNTANGVYALFDNTSGGTNTGIGANALKHNTAGNSNTAIGAYSQFNNISGTRNVSVGVGALYTNTTGSSNTSTGNDALANNTTGTGNTANGDIALYYNSGGIYNTALGLEALRNNSTGSFNTAVGTSALYSNTTSYYNTAVGYFAMTITNSGYNNTAIGAFTGPATDFEGLFNTIAVGNSTFVTASNQARFGNSSTTSIGGYANWTNISDGRIKKNIKANVPGLSFINKLQPVTYNLDLDAADKITRTGAKKDKDGKMLQPGIEEINARNAKKQILYTGFVAQDVEKAAKELNYDFSGVDAAKNDRDLYGLRYAEFVVPLVKAVQELSSQNEKLKSQNEEQLKINADLEKRIEKLETLLTTTASSNNSQELILNPLPGGRGASLEQNIPNPFNKTTTINYTLPQQYSSAKIIITDNAGKALKEMNISGTGKGSLQIDVSAFASGTYQYSLLVNGKLINTKQMVLVK